MEHEACFEVHIVGYEGSDLSGVPAPFFLNVIDLSTQGFTGIATSEQSSLEQAYRDFALGIEWSESALQMQPDFGVHVKLEQMREQKVYDQLRMKRLPGSRTQKVCYIQSQLVSAWDVHLDGQFDPGMKKALHKDGYIVLDYLSSKGENLSTLTMHFLRPEECIQEYQNICETIALGGGFRGNIYYEDPLAFVVYGKTIPRPIVQSFS